MKSNGLSKLYDTLTLDERFRLRLRAFARRDMVDCERLDRTCPLTQYQEYCARIEASDVLTLCVMVELLPKLAKLSMVGAFRPLVEHLEGLGKQAGWMGYLDGYAAGWRAAGKRGEPPGASDDDLDVAANRAFRLEMRFSDVLGQVADTLTESSRTPRDALATFAKDELGLTLEILLGAWAPNALPMLAEHADAIDAAEPNADELALSARVLDLAWRRQGLMDSKAEADDDLKSAILAQEVSAT